MSRLALLAAAATLACAAPAFAGTVVPVAPFKALALHGGGDVVLKYGPVQKVTLISGSTQYTSFIVKEDGLEIDACATNASCPNHYDLRVEIVTPQLSALSVHGGGDVTAQGSFPRQNNLALSVHGGGDVDVKAIPATSVTASVHGGGDLRTTVQQSLTAAVNGGGDITYWGNPQQLTVATHGGGEISRGD